MTTNVQKNAIGSITQFQAVRNATSTQVSGATTNLNTVRLDGIALTAASNGNNVYVITDGMIAPLSSKIWGRLFLCCWM